MRQHHGGVVHQGGRRDQVFQTNAIDHQTIEVLRSRKDFVDTSPSAKPEQHSDKQTVTTGSGTSNRMGNSPGPVATSVRPLGMSVDRFVCCICQQEVKKCPKFVSPFPDPRAAFIDALSIPWSRMGTVYAFPPFKVNPSVLAKIRQSVALTVILIAPYRMDAS